MDGISDGNLYRITTSGDGAGMWEVRGWENVVAEVAADMYSEPSEAEREDVRDMLTEGIDSDGGWNGRSVALQFEDSSLLVELLPAPDPG